MTKTLQILVEGDYAGIFKPSKHYIPLKRDFSNIDEILKLLHDEAYCQKIIDAAYVDIVMTEKYTYRAFAQMVVNHIRQQNTSEIQRSRKDSLVFSVFSCYLAIRNTVFNLCIKLIYYTIIYPIKITGLDTYLKRTKLIYPVLKKLNQQL